jgi:hypothetical protein
VDGRKEVKGKKKLERKDKGDRTKKKKVSQERVEGSQN